MHQPTILFCGGGSSGHLAPSLAVEQALHAHVAEFQAVFVCARREDEIALLEHEKKEYRCIAAGKFPRGLTAQWLTFPFLFSWSLVQSVLLLRSLQPAVVFSKGGYVSVPVCLAAKLLGVPVVLHESDAVSGMGNGVITKMAQVVCVGFPPVQVLGNRDVEVGNKVLQNSNHVSTANPQSPIPLFTGNPVRPDIRQGTAAAGRTITGFSGKRPVLMIIGGSQGAKAVNDAVIGQIGALLDMADIIHITGHGKETGLMHARYWSSPFVTGELAHLYALADVVITRAGAGTLSELAALSKAAIVIPLRGVAQDHQYANARRLEEAGAIVLVEQEGMDVLTSAVRGLIDQPERRKQLGEALHKFFPEDAEHRIAEILAGYLEKA